MNIEKDLIIALLKLTSEGVVSHELINKDAKIPSTVARKLLETLQSGGMLNLQKDCVRVDGFQRLKLAVRAVSLGADLERVSGLLDWQEFEGIGAIGLQRNGYVVARNLRFAQGGRRWEIDLVGCRKPAAVCVDCKHWRRGLSPSGLKRVVEEQTERTVALAKSLPNPAIKIECVNWNKVKFIPVVLTLVQGASKFHKNVPIVPVLQMQDFLHQLPAYADTLFQITKMKEESLDLSHDF